MLVPGINYGNVRVLLRECITALLALAQISRHCSPGVRVRKVRIIEHTIKLLIKRLRSAISKSDGHHAACLAIGAILLTSYMISFSAVASARRLFTSSHWRLVLWSSTRDFSIRLAFCDRILVL